MKSFIDMTPEDAKERFLHDYIVNMKWKEKDDDFIPQYLLLLINKLDTMILWARRR